MDKITSSPARVLCNHILVHIVSKIVGDLRVFILAFFSLSDHKYLLEQDIDVGGCVLFLRCSSY